jgi:hypothetical protein
VRQLPEAQILDLQEDNKILLDELVKAVDILIDLTRSIECYEALHKPKEEWLEYDEMMNPAWIKAVAFLKELQASRP